jgi:hypothetical protein
MFMFISHDFMSWKFWKLSHKKIHDKFFVSFVLFDIPISWTIVCVIWSSCKTLFVLFNVMWPKLNIKNVLGTKKNSIFRCDYWTVIYEKENMKLSSKNDNLWNIKLIPLN